MLVISLLHHVESRCTCTCSFSHFTESSGLCGMQMMFLSLMLLTRAFDGFSGSQLAGRWARRGEGEGLGVAEEAAQLIHSIQG